MATQFDRIGQRFVTRDELDGLNYEVLNNLVLELTKLGIENRNLRMRLESMATRLDFDERRQRAFEGLVQFKAATAPVAPRAASPETGDDEDEGDEAPDGAVAATPAGDAGRAGKRRRRRRGRKRGPDGAPSAPGGQGASGHAESGPSNASAPATAPSSEPARGGSDGQ